MEQAAAERADQLAVLQKTNTTGWSGRGGETCLAHNYTRETH